MKLTLETDREDDGRWIAEVPELPGVLAYAATQEEAMVKAEALALRVLAEQLDDGEAKPIELSFAVVPNRPLRRGKGTSHSYCVEEIAR